MSYETLGVLFSIMVLNPGDIAFVEFNFDNPDSFEFVALTDILTGETIEFTDNGWLASGGFRSGEGIFTWTAPADISAGSVVEVDLLTGPAFASSGDQILAYQGPAANPTFIAALHSDGTSGWQADATNTNTSALPSGLTDGTNAIAIPEVDNGKYNGITTGDRATLLAAINNPNNWMTDNSTRQEFSGTFSITNGNGLGTDGNLLITELADPNNDAGARYVELYASGGDVDLTGLQLVRWTNGNTAFTAGSAIDLENLGTNQMLSEGEFLVIAANATTFNATYNATADFAAGTGGPADSNGDDQIGIIDANGTILDIFGVPGEDGTGTDHEFEDGRAERKATATSPSATYDAADWNIDSDAPSGDGPIDAPNGFDPGVWIGSPIAGTTLAISPDNATQAEGDAGTTDFTFTVTRSGDTSGATAVDFAVTGDADAADFGGTLPSGTVNFADGETTQTITISVVGDTDAEPDESLTVTLSNPANDETLTTPSTSGTIQNDDGIALALISEIQGSGAASTLVGNTVTIQGIVVGDFQNDDADTGRNLGGFYVQEEDADADGSAATSEGIFVFDSSFGTDVNIGDQVTVTGLVDEFFGETQIDTVSAVTINSTGNSLPTAASISLPAVGTSTAQDGDLQADLEAYEGMLVNFTDELTVTEMFQLDRFNEIKLSQGGRLEQFTQNNAPSVSGYATHQEDIAKRTITYDDGLNVQNALIGNLDGFGPTFSTATDIRMGDTINGLSGVLDYKWAGNSASQGTWRVRATEDGSNTFTKVNNRPAAPADVGGDLKVVSLNVLNFFTTLDANGATTDTGLDPRGADTQSEYDRQLQKLVTAILDMDADVYGLVEVENSNTSAALAALTAELNNQAPAGTTYSFINTGAIGSDAIAVGFLYKANSVTPEGNFAVLDTSAFLDPNNTGSDRNRPALAQTFKENATGELFTPVVNHFKSKGSSGVQAGTADAEQNDGQGNWNDTRTKAAIALDTWLDTDPTNSGDPDVLILGDLNAYAQEDPITTLEGLGYTDLADQFIGTDAYSFVFDGQVGTLDYAMANADLLSQVTGATEWHVNADEPDAIDYNEDFGRDPNIFDASVPYRNSDHDPVIVGLDLTSPTSPTSIGEIGVINGLNENFQTINLLQTYIDPVVVVNPASFNGADPVAIRLNNLDSDSFDVFLQEPSNLDGRHTFAEQVNYMVIESGNWELANGTRLEAGNFNRNGLVTGGFWEDITFESEFFDEGPAVFSQIQSFNGADFSVTRQRNTSNSGVQIGIQEQDSLIGSGHVTESLGYIAMETGTGEWDDLTYTAGVTDSTVNHLFSDLVFSGFETTPNLIASVATFNGADQVGLRYRNLGSTGVQLKLREDTSADAEVGHFFAEEVSYLALEGSGLLSGFAI